MLTTLWVELLRYLSITEAAITESTLSSFTNVQCDQENLAACIYKDDRHLANHVKYNVEHMDNYSKE